MFILLFISHHFTCSHPSHSLKNPASVTAAVPVGGEPMRVVIASCTAGSSWCKLHSVVCYTRYHKITNSDKVAISCNILQYPVRKNVELWWICELCRLKSRSSPHRHHKANSGVFWDLCTLACFHMLSVQLEINSLSSYSASTLLNSTADLQVLKCLETVDEKLLQLDLAKLSTGHSKQEIFEFDTSVISHNGHRQSLRGNQEDRHKSRCETLWNIPQI